MCLRFVSFAWCRIGFDCLLYDREKLKKKGITPKDYERENKLRLKLMQKQNREQRMREVLFHINTRDSSFEIIQRLVALTCIDGHLTHTGSGTT